MDNTEEQTEEQIQEFRNIQYACTHPESWIWNEELISWVAPKAAPQDGKPYIWDEEIQDWILFPDYPSN